MQSTKHHLRRVLAEQSLTYEEFIALLTRIEAILDSRTLCPLSYDPADGTDYLTPGHFLVEAPLLLSRPEVDWTEEESLRGRWPFVVKAIQDF